MSTPYLALLSEVLAGPLLLRQGKRLRRTIPRLPEAEGARSGFAGEGLPLRLMIVGDSAAAGVGVATQAEALSGQLVTALAGAFEVHWQLHARSGFTTRDASVLLDGVAEQPMDVIVTSLGLNDVLARQSAASFLSAQREFLELLRRRFAPAQVLLTAIPPLGDFPGFPQPLRFVMSRRRDWLDEQLQQLCAERAECEHLTLAGKLASADMATDGFHPGPRLYAQWAQAAAARIRQRFWRER